MRIVSFVCQITQDNMTCTFLTTLSVLTILPSGHFYEYTGKANVTGCPKNQSEVIIASGKLGCGQDKYGNNQYMCLPNKDKSFLVELCYDGVMGIQERGICLEIFEGKLIQHSCKYFSDGCPEKDFYDYELFKYPSCQDINTKFHCYVSDPNCPPKQHTGEQSNQYTSVYVIIIVGFILAIVGFIMKYLWKKRKRIANETRRSNTDEMDPLSKDETRRSSTDEMDSFSKEKREEIRIVFLGCEGSGKSAIVNTILGRNCFVESSTIPHSSCRFGYNLVILNTPGIPELSTTDEHTREEIRWCISHIPPGPHVFIVVLDKTSFEQAYQQTIDFFVKIFDEDMFNYLIILFTKGDKSEESLDDYIKTLPTEFKNNMDRYCRRIIKFGKEKEQESKVGELLEMMKGVIEKNDNGCYPTVKGAKRRVV